ncbi:hydroxylamine reductase [candidate division CSSED10-310 bacterium]|uniref:Hydroxylamine reductase n=1 Tax=candidate division CSSED10-310 bacterium TaxID=2855610 RepID=A0ABV6Z0S7_UNCC1
MFCYQCEQTSKGKGCTAVGICGKDPATAALQDLLVQVVKEISYFVHHAGNSTARDAALDTFVIKALFTTVTNVNFDPQRVKDMIMQAVELRQKAQGKYLATAPERASDFSVLDITPDQSLEELIGTGAQLEIEKRISDQGEDITGVEELIMYGLKGTAAYVDHASILGYKDDAVFAFFHEALAFLTQKHELGELVPMALRVGEVNLKVMGLLDEAHTSTFGHPVPTQVRITPLAGKAILVSGHDLLDLSELLRQTEGTGINVYSHGEMLPAHGYPELNKYKHFVGNYGGAWQDQGKEFADFPGAILMTTNCIQNPKDTYKDRIFTAGLVAWPGLKHIQDHDYQPLIEAALQQDGFEADESEKLITVGFGHNAVLNVADKVIEAVKSGQIKHFFLIGGCDGAKSGRNYYTDFAQTIPQDTVILTLACGKYRFNKMEFGDIGGIPRLLDIGQCNDAYSAIQIAVALSKAFNTDVNSLPLSMILSWYEQKAVCILLSLLHLGIKNIRLGPSLPAFISPAVLNVLVENFQIAPITTVEEDLKAILN